MCACSFGVNWLKVSSSGGVQNVMYFFRAVLNSVLSNVMLALLM